MDIVITKPRLFSLKLFLLLSVFIFSTLIIYLYFPIGTHWREIFRPAALEFLSLRSPYTVEKFFNPPWALLPVIPFAILPERLGNALWASCTLFGFGYVSRKMGASWWITILFLALPEILYNTIQLNVDWLVALGFILPPQIGLFLIMLKPQVGAFLALFWFIETARLYGIKGVIRVFGPFTAAIILSIIIFGPYPLRSIFMASYFQGLFWPLSIPVGLALLVQSIYSRKSGLSIACAPLLSPYTQPYTWPLAILGVISNKVISVSLMVGFWLIIFVDNRFSYLLTVLIQIFYK
jgi:hypothetical protein